MRYTKAFMKSTKMEDQQEQPQGHRRSKKRSPKGSLKGSPMGSPMESPQESLEESLEELSEESHKESLEESPKEWPEESLDKGTTFYCNCDSKYVGDSHSNSVGLPKRSPQGRDRSQDRSPKGSPVRLPQGRGRSPSPPPSPPRSRQRSLQRSRDRNPKTRGEADTHRKIEGDLPNAKPKSYYGRDLTRTLHRNSNTDIATRPNKDEMRVLRLPIAPVTAEEETKTLMDQYYPIFDKAFFFGHSAKTGNPVLKFSTMMKETHMVSMSRAKERLTSI
ncbi:hypothetical protein BKA61DRAFT_569199 [Leptodontidium sp. MPI-SDFR-AT-0119]|nr:hypothetical protein BKA61DRAFT_569199 [Leptodontidium sp. MPI-SDFR-AT-0119]